MKRAFLLCLAAVTALSLCGCAKENSDSSAPTVSSSHSAAESSAPSGAVSASEVSESDVSDANEEDDKVNENIMYIKVNGTTFTADLEDNSSAAALVELLKKGDVTVDMHDYANFEKVGALPQSLPRNDKQITTGAGDIILYQGDQIVIYYDTNSWNFTQLGKIRGVSQSELKKVLGSGNAIVTFSLTN